MCQEYLASHQFPVLPPGSFPHPPPAGEGLPKRLMGVFAGFWAVSRSKTRLEMNLGGLSGLGAAAGVFGVEVLNVLTMPLSEEVTAGGVWLVEKPLVEKFRRQEIASTSISSSSTTTVLALTFFRNGEVAWSRTTPLEPLPASERPLLPP